MRREKFEVHSVGLVQVGVHVVVWVAVVLNEDGFEEKGGFVFPFVVNEGDDAYALYPQPDLPAGLRLVLGGDLKCHGGYVDVCFQSEKHIGCYGGVRVADSGVRLVDDLVDQSGCVVCNNPCCSC